MEDLAKNSILEEPKELVAIEGPESQSLRKSAE